MPTCKPSLGMVSFCRQRPLPRQTFVKGYLVLQHMEKPSLPRERGQASQKSSDGSPRREWFSIRGIGPNT